MDDGDDFEPPTEAARETLRSTEHFAGVVLLEAQIRTLHRTLRLDEGGSDAG